MFLPRPQTFTTPLLDHHTLLKLFPKHKAVLQVQVQALKVSLSWNNVLTTPMSYSKTLRTHGKTFNPFSTLTLPMILSPTQTLMLHLSHSTCLKLMKQNTSKTKVYLDQRQIRRHKRQYEKDTGDVSPSRYPSTP